MTQAATPSWLDQLPGPLPGLVASAPSIPPAVPLLSALTVIGAAAGRSALLQAGPGNMITGELQTLIATPDESAVQQVINAVVAPFRAIQAELLQAQARQPAASLRADLVRTERERDELFERLRFPDPEHAAYFATKLGQLKSALHPLVLLEGPSSRLRPALERSFDQSVMLLSATQDAGNGLLNAWASYRGRADLEIIQAAQRQQPYVGGLLDGTAESALAAPGVSALLLCSSTALDTFLVHPDAALINEATGFWTMNPQMSADTVGPSARVPAPPEWEALIRRLFAARQAGQQTVYQLTAKSLEWLARNEKLWLDTPKASADLVRRAIRRVYPFSLLLHLCSPAPTAEIPVQTVVAAMEVVRDLWPHQHALLRSFRSGSPIEWFVQDELVGAPGRRLTVKGCLRAYTEYCQRLGLPPPRQRGFKELVAPAIQAAYGVKIRCDLSNSEGKAQRGWKQVWLRNPKKISVVVY